MRPALGAAFVALLLAAPAPAAAAIMGHPGAPSPAFSMRASVGLGYSVLNLDNGNDFQDDVRRLRILGRVSLMLLDWLEVAGEIEGADARRDLTEFEAGLGLGGGAMLRLYPLLQDDFGVNLGLGGGFLFRSNDGNAPNQFGGNTYSSAELKERQYHAELTLSRSFQIWNLYGGLMWHMVDMEQNRIPNEPAGSSRNLGSPGETDARLPVGIFVGVDYYVTPLIFFSLEGQNFHEDTITASIGVMLSP